MPASGKYKGQTINANGCYEGDVSHGTETTCTAGIGTGPSDSQHPGGRPVYEAGRMTTKVSDLLAGSRNFHLTYHFHLGQPDHGGGGTTEITAGYDGSSDDETATGITIGLRDTNGAVIARTEDHNKQHKVPGEYYELCQEGSECGGVSHIPEFSKANGGTYGKQFDIIWVGSQVPGGVNYKEYVNVGGKSYLIANLNNPRTGGRGGGKHGGPGGGSIINYATQHNYFARGRTNNSGMNAQISGVLYADDDNIYTPPGKIITRDSGFYDGYYYS